GTANTTSGPVSQLQALDGRNGRLLRNYPAGLDELPETLPIVEAGYSMGRGRGSHDLNGDGRADWIRFSGKTMEAVDGHTKRLLWTAAVLGDVRRDRFLEILPATAERGAVVVVQSGSQTVHGLDGLTGRPLWRCDGPGEPVAVLPNHNPG